YRRLALEEGKSFAELVRNALTNYQKHTALGSDQKIRLEAAKRILANRAKIDTSTKNLIEFGRKI
ncbi:MAG: hypothetical protein Q7T50_07885, partial [Candidatus Magasanikbacteria bacterium]|nr:hypothetical protein [Candidatus Magasanikbacteria bacterium]